MIAGMYPLYMPDNLYVLLDNTQGLWHDAG